MFTAIHQNQPNNKREKILTYLKQAGKRLTSTVEGTKILFFVKMAGSRGKII